MDRIEGRPGASMQPLDFTNLENKLKDRFGPTVRETDVMSAAMYPKETEEYLDFKESYGPVDKLDTRIFLVGPKVGEEFEACIEQGKTLAFKTLAVSADMTKKGEREVFFELNGQLRSVFIQDKSAAHVRPRNMLIHNFIRL
jgi:pyruvate carboxylase